MKRVDDLGTAHFGRGKSALSMTCLVVFFALVASVAAGQGTGSTTPPAVSDLAKRNMGIVAASPSQVEPILRTNPGLLLELKNWMAREAANEGRLLTDNDLSDMAVFDRLKIDSAFRAVATRLLQRYGYLSPELNPDSPEGKRQDYLMKERIKRQLARDEQIATLPTPPQKPDKTVTCSPDDDPDCEQMLDQRRAAFDREGADDTVGPPRGSDAFSDQQRTLMDTAGISADQISQAQRLASGQMNPFALGGESSRNGLQSGALEGQGGLPPGLMSEAASRLLGGGQTDVEAQPTRAFEPVVPRDSTGVPSTDRVSAGMRTPERPAPPAMVRVKNPYNSIPSLYDMYSQAPDLNPDPRLAEPKRFGTDVFKRGTRASQRIPMDMPAGPDYVIGPGDTLTVSLSGGVSRRIVRIVDREGRLELPDVGAVMVSGKTLADAQRMVQDALRVEFRDISVDVSLTKLRTVRVYVVGDVTRPGAYDISALSTALNALFVAGGPTANGSLRVVRHYRGSRLLEDVDVYDLILKGVRSPAHPLENGDTILVPPIGPQVTVNGAVRRPALYETNGEKNLSDVLDLAGGMLPTASLQHIEVQRLIAHQSRTMLSFNISEKDDQKSINQRLAAFRVEPGDVVQVFSIAPFNPDAVYLQGHVLRPGRYSYHKNMRLSDVIASYADLLPEPAARYGEIIRLTPPAYAPTVFSFNLAEALEKPAASPLLQPMDTVRIFSKYDFEDPPTVTVTGAVRHPGTYRTAGLIHVSDAVHLGGNLTVDAFAEDAQVVHHQPDGTIQVMNVNLKRAEAGDPSDNLLLASGDRVLVHEDLSKSDPPSVSIQGEVANPGRYPLTSALRVSDLVQVAGGLKRSADTSSADLVHYFPVSPGQPAGQQETIQLDAALARQAPADQVLRDGDVLTVRRVGGWNDIGASVTLEGEVAHPGTYGFQPGERLSSVLIRAGGFSANAYPYAAVLSRTEVRQLEELNRAELVRRLQSEEQQLKLMPDADAEQKKAREAALDQMRTTIGNLLANQPVGRVVIKISGNFERWANTSADIQLRAGDKLFVPKRLESVAIIGQVYNPTAVAFRAGRSAEWYLNQAGGPTSLANHKAVFVIRADGSVVGKHGSFWVGGSLKTSLMAGDTVVVPEKAYTGGRNLQNLLLIAQVTSAVTSAAYLFSLTVP